MFGVGFGQVSLDAVTEHRHSGIMMKLWMVLALGGSGHVFVFCDWVEVHFHLV